MDIIHITIAVSLLCGFMAVVAVLLRHYKTGDVSVVLILSGVALIALPLASSIKLGKDGLEVQIRDQVAFLSAHAQANTAKSADKGPASAPSATVTALVFFKDEKGDDARKLVALLRTNGFLSSATATDFSELGLRRFS